MQVAVPQTKLVARLLSLVLFPSLFVSHSLRPAGRRVVGSDETEPQTAYLIPPSDCCLHEYLQLEMGPFHFSFVFLQSACCAAAISS